MSLLIDQNLPRDLERFLARDLPGSVHVRSLGLERALDSTLWSEARSRCLAILSKDSDFMHRSSMLGHPPKVILIRRRNCSTREVCALVAASVPTVHAFLKDPASALLVID